MNAAEIMIAVLTVRQMNDLTFVDEISRFTSPIPSINMIDSRVTLSRTEQRKWTSKKNWGFHGRPRFCGQINRYFPLSHPLHGRTKPFGLMESRHIIIHYLSDDEIISTDHFEAIEWNEISPSSRTLQMDWALCGRSAKLCACSCDVVCVECVCSNN